MSNETTRQQSFSRRAFVLGGSMAAVGTALIARMTWLAIFEGEQYRLASE
ncbi:MAG: hypothetical protein H7267_13255, partial [Sandarakinorhabdus sp.]|nr:hypothetical protein [Sandarakinorhabdus sp.]